jgi:hypothetical protein
VAGSGTSRAGFEPPPNRELSRLPISDIIGSLLDSATVKRTYTLRVGRTWWWCVRPFCWNPRSKMKFRCRGFSCNEKY